MREFFWCGVLRFCWGFWGNWVVNVVFLWTECGGLGGEDGLWEDGFWVGDFMQVLGIYFGGGRHTPGAKARLSLRAALGYLEATARATTTVTQKLIPAG
jgi:hypothetical protein